VTRAVASAIVVFCLSTPAAAQAPLVVYGFEPLPKTPVELAKRFTPAQIAILEMLNRRDRGHLPRVEPPTPGLVADSPYEVAVPVTQPRVIRHSRSPRLDQRPGAASSGRGNI